MSRALIPRLFRSLVEAADWVPGSAEAKRYGWRGGYCFCDGQVRHDAACRRARKVLSEAQAFLGARETTPRRRSVRPAR